MLQIKGIKSYSKDFANIAHIPYSTLNNWGTMAQNGKIIPVPSWVRPFRVLYDKSLRFDILRHQIFKNNISRRYKK